MRGCLTALIYNQVSILKCIEYHKINDIFRINISDVNDFTRCFEQPSPLQTTTNSFSQVWVAFYVQIKIANVSEMTNDSKTILPSKILPKKRGQKKLNAGISVRPDPSRSRNWNGMGCVATRIIFVRVDRHWLLLGNFMWWHICLMNYGTGM